MLIAIDVGNTSIAFALMKGQRVQQTEQVPTELGITQMKISVRRIFQKWKMRKDVRPGVIVCSVVPHVLKILEPELKKYTHSHVIVVGRDMKVPLINRYSVPGQVGQDRLVCAYAAKQLYGTPAIIVDLGTAITFDVVSSKDEYLGGIIVPGIQLSADALFRKAALLPKIHIARPNSLIGKDTQGSILSGIFFGYGEMIKGLIALIDEKISGKPQVIVTGGYTDLMKRYIRQDISRIDSHLVFKGLSFLFTQKD